MKRAIVSVLATLALLSALVPLTAWQNTPTLGVLPDSGPSLPATCVVGQIYFKTTATAGLNQCTPANTWTALATASGSGTVNAGTTGQYAFYAGNGTTVSGGGPITTNVFAKGDATNALANSLFTDTGTTATYTGTGGIVASGAGGLSAGANGGAVGVLNLFGNTSGTATITAPAVAGTATNPVVFINNIQLPTGDTTHASVGLGSTQNGLAVTGSSPIMIVGGSQIAQFTTTGINLVAGDYRTNTNCAGVGTAANPSVVTCTGAPAGAFSCATNASGGTCQVNTAIVTANSQIFIQPNASEGARLSVTCNTTADTPTGPRLASKSAGASFTINLGTVTTNPVCFDFIIVN